MTIHASPTWQRSMRRALDSGYKPTRLADGRYRVPSKSAPGSFQYVTLDERGHIIHCTCKGWEQGGRQRPCWHAGAVAIGIAHLDGHSIVPMHEELAPVQGFRPTQDQIYRTVWA